MDLFLRRVCVVLLSWQLLCAPAVAFALPCSCSCELSDSVQGACCCGTASKSCCQSPNSPVDQRGCCCSDATNGSQCTCICDKNGKAPLAVLSGIAQLVKLISFAPTLLSQELQPISQGRLYESSSRQCWTLDLPHYAQTLLCCWRE